MYTVPPQGPPPPPPAPFPLHKTKLISLIVGAVALIGMILPWASASMGQFGSRNLGNGFQGWGILSLFGLIAVIVSSLVGDKMRDYDQNMRYLAIGAFSAIALGSLIAFMQLNGNAQLGTTVKSGIGVWFTIIAGILGLLWVTGVIKFNPQPRPHGYPPQQQYPGNYPPQNNYPPQYPQHHNPQYPQQPGQHYPPQYPQQQPYPQQPPPHQPQ